MIPTVTHTPILPVEQFPVNIEQKQDNVGSNFDKKVGNVVEGSKNNIEELIKVAYEDYQNGGELTVDLSKLNHYASNSNNIYKETFIDVSKYPKSVQKDFNEIFDDFQRYNPGVMLGKSNPYWKYILKAIVIKNKKFSNLSEIQAGQQAINKAVSYSGITHNTGGPEAHLYRYFKYKTKVLQKISNNPELTNFITQGEKNYTTIKSKYKYYSAIKKIVTGKKLYKGDLKSLNVSPSFFNELVNYALTKDKGRFFSKDFIYIAENKKVIAENKKVIAENKKVIAENKKVIAENKKVIAEVKRQIRDLDNDIDRINREIEEGRGNIKELEIAIKSRRQLLKFLRDNS